MSDLPPIECGTVKGTLKAFKEIIKHLPPPQLVNTGTSAIAMNQIVDLWLRGEKNEARLILEAFKIGLDEGRRERKE